ncbi:ECF transporter S component [Miniphocaeibacter halophilus]|uniref:ECF transporter S component n=1 Tax=Miniphocaeibacter halophilus TaxID=2931922 RepID=A0AC61MWH0_9FIRM|nr:ECF transporter S component [Miniphocaeibacter halophilus]QQK07961.1 ECF transporter S component [Miniphocaeibacter halophilus]
MKTKKLVYSSLLLSIGIILPTLVHLTGIPGNVFLPMHIPVLIAGLLLGPTYGAIIGVLLPLINFLIINMPPIPTLYIMTFELLGYGLFSGIIYKRTSNIILSLVCSMIIGRIFGAIVSYVLFTMLGMSKISPYIWLSGSIITGLPGIIIQLLLIPIIVKALMKKAY